MAVNGIAESRGGSDSQARGISLPPWGLPDLAGQCPLLKKSTQGLPSSKHFAKFITISLHLATSHVPLE